MCSAIEKSERKKQRTKQLDLAVSKKIKKTVSSFLFLHSHCDRWTIKRSMDGIVDIFCSTNKHNKLQQIKENRNNWKYFQFHSFLPPFGSYRIRYIWIVVFFFAESKSTSEQRTHFDWVCDGRKRRRERTTRFQRIRIYDFFSCQRWMNAFDRLHIQIYLFFELVLVDGNFHRFMHSKNLCSQNVVLSN